MRTLDHSIGFLLTRTARSMKRALEARLSEFSLTASQYVVLELLNDEDGISLSLLGRRLYFDNPTITGIIDRLERDGLAERQRTAEDRRVINIVLTQKGRDVISKVSDIAETINRDAMTEMNRQQEAQFIASLNLIWKKMNGELV